MLGAFLVQARSVSTLLKPGCIQQLLYMAFTKLDFPGFLGMDIPLVPAPRTSRARTSHLPPCAPEIGPTCARIRLGIGPTCARIRLGIGATHARIWLGIGWHALGLEALRVGQYSACLSWLNRESLAL